MGLRAGCSGLGTTGSRRHVFVRLEWTIFWGDGELRIVGSILEGLCSDRFFWQLWYFAKVSQGHSRG